MENRKNLGVPFNCFESIRAVHNAQLRYKQGTSPVFTMEWGQSLPK